MAEGTTNAPKDVNTCAECAAHDERIAHLETKLSGIESLVDAIARLVEGAEA